MLMLQRNSRPNAVPPVWRYVFSQCFAKALSEKNTIWQHSNVSWRKHVLAAQLACSQALRLKAGSQSPGFEAQSRQSKPAGSQSRPSVKAGKDRVPACELDELAFLGILELRSSLATCAQNSETHGKSAVPSRLRASNLLFRAG
jgi:hypothetical protein